MQESDDDLLGVSEVAAMLKVSRKTVTRMVKESRLPKPTDYGGLVRWRRGIIREWQRAMEVIGSLGNFGTLTGSFGTSGDTAPNEASNPKKPR